MTLKKTILISALGHLAMFSIFSFSFGNRLIKTDFAGVAFLGKILETSDLFSAHQSFRKELINRQGHLMLAAVSTPPLILNNAPQSTGWGKPAVAIAFKTEKIAWVDKPASRLPVKIKSQVIMLYPHLPYSFLLYFKDRQAVHIELMFNIISNHETNYIALKRKISSGNLEADLLTRRYINHYLFIQQAGFSKNNWQSVKIDLSTKND